MSRYAETIAFGGVAVILFDAIASIASKQFGFPYTYAIVGTIAICIVLGCFLGSSFDRRGSTIVSTGIFVGLIDSTLGWTVSYFIGPGKINTHLTFALWFRVFLFVIISDITFIAIGYFISTLLFRRVTNRASQ